MPGVSNSLSFTNNFMDATTKLTSQNHVLPCIAFPISEISFILVSERNQASTHTLACVFLLPFILSLSTLNLCVSSPLHVADFRCFPSQQIPLLRYTFIQSLSLKFIRFYEFNISQVYFIKMCSCISPIEIPTNFLSSLP